MVEASKHLLPAQVIPLAAALIGVAWLLLVRSRTLAPGTFKAPAPVQRTPSGESRLRELATRLASGSRRSPVCTFGAIVLLGVWAFPLRPGLVVGNSMDPTLRDGEVYVLDRGYYHRHPLSRGDVVVFRRGTNILVKRVVALPGDPLILCRTPDGAWDEMVSPRQLPVWQRILTRAKPSCFRLVFLRLPRGSCYVVGDNPGVSVDSRAFGPVPIGEIEGRVVLPPVRVTVGADGVHRVMDGPKEGKPWGSGPRSAPSAGPPA